MENTYMLLGRQEQANVSRDVFTGQANPAAVVAAVLNSMSNMLVKCLCS